MPGTKFLSERVGLPGFDPKRLACKMAFLDGGPSHTCCCWDASRIRRRFPTSKNRLRWGRHPSLSPSLRSRLSNPSRLLCSVSAISARPRDQQGRERGVRGREGGVRGPPLSLESVAVISAPSPPSCKAILAMSLSCRDPRAALTVAIVGTESLPTRIQNSNLDPILDPSGGKLDPAGHLDSRPTHPPCPPSEAFLSRLATYEPSLPRAHPRIHSLHVTCEPCYVVPSGLAWASTEAAWIRNPPRPQRPVR